MVKVYVDDERTAPEGWVQAWNIRDAIKLIEDNYQDITHIDFDYYLSKDNQHHTGLRLLQELKYSGLDIFHQPKENYTFHSSDESMNQRMREYLFPTDSKPPMSRLDRLRNNKGRR
jgi:hypothetical protein